MDGWPIQRRMWHLVIIMQQRMELAILGWCGKFFGGLWQCVAPDGALDMDIPHIFGFQTQWIPQLHILLLCNPVLFLCLLVNLVCYNVVDGHDVWHVCAGSK